jgi:hypothetical protein
MKNAVEMGSDAMVYILSFLKIGSGIQELLEGDTYRDTQPHRNAPTESKMIS